MGYTHYFEAKRSFTDAEWVSLCAATTTIIAASPAKIVGENDDPSSAPEIGDELIAFNGPGDDGHETFWLPKLKSGFQFCKTARKPYDVVVVAILCAAQALAPGALRIASDGGSDGMVAGLELARLACPGLCPKNPLQVPA